MKYLLQSPMGKATITEAIITPKQAITLFKSFLMGKFGNVPDNRFHVRACDLHLTFKTTKARFVAVKEQSKKLDLTRPFYNTEKKEYALNHELWIWCNLRGFHKLGSNLISPLQSATQLDYKPEFILVIKTGREGKREWCTIECDKWIGVIVKAQPNDWKMDFLKQYQKHA